MPDLFAAFDNLWFVLNFVVGIVFLLAAVYFTVNPQKCSFLISNYAHLPKEKRERYDLNGLSKHLSRIFTVCALVCLAGAVGALFCGAPAYWAATVVWIALAVATLRVDNEKVLRKYRRD